MGPHKGGQLEAVVGESRQLGRQTMVGFSAWNASSSPIELLSPQVDLAITGRGKRHRVVSDPVPLLDYRMTKRRLGPGERTDGVVVFERPPVKTSNAGLQLRLAQAEEADRPIVLPLPFVATSSQEAR